jgi:hypothetical protein
MDRGGNVASGEMKRDRLRVMRTAAGRARARTNFG